MLEDVVVKALGERGSMALGPATNEHTTLVIYSRATKEAKKFSH